MTAPERITLDHKGIGKTSFSGHGALDMNAEFRADYIRSDIAERSQKSHNHEFATIRDLWQSWPEDRKDVPYAKSADTLRKHALISTGFCNVDQVVFESEESLKRNAPVLASAARRDHGYAIASAKGLVFTVMTPHTQSKSAMGAKAFQESKAAVIEWIKKEMGI